MRLTLRTLLAYLDDTLEPSEIAEIGQKVAESDKAQELIARIKQVTRRRRLTTPPMSGPGAFDANDVAEYLDNVLPSERVKELEQLAQDSDVHLAEIAASHQILTLVQGEPALVPPTAKSRFYELVTGKESDRRKAARPSKPVEKAPLLSGDSDADETLLLGLPDYQKAPWLRWALPVGAVVLLVLIAGCLYLLLPKHPDRGTPVASATTPTTPADKDRTGDKTPDKTGDKKDNNVVPPDKDKQDKDKQPDKTGDKAPDKDKVDDKGSKDKPLEPMKEFPREPSKERREAGTFGSPKAVLVRRPDKADRWERVKPEGAVFTTEPLVALPGYQCDLRLANGVGVRLYGCLHELINWEPSVATEVNIPPAESAVTLHVPNHNCDAELTLHRGRIYLSNGDKPARVAVRFGPEEVYEISLVEPQTRVALQMGSEFHPSYAQLANDTPLMELDLFVEKGEVSVKHGAVTHGLMTGTARNRLIWCNKKALGRPFTAVGEPSEFGTKPVKADTEKEWRAPLEELNNHLTEGKLIEVSLLSGVQGYKERQRMADLSVRCLGAIDATGALVGVLNDATLTMGLRHQAISTLRRYVSRGKEELKRLYDPATKGGVLVDKGQLTPAEAERVAEMLRTFFVDGARDAAVLDVFISLLREDKLPVRELAYWHLRLLVGAQGINYDAAAQKDTRDMGADAWKQLRTSNKLPLKQDR